MHIIFLTKYGNLAASSRLRAFQYKNKIDLPSYQVDVKSLLGNSYIEKKFNNKPVGFFYLFYSFIKRLFFLFGIRRYDVVVIHIELFPFVPPIFEWFLFKSKRKIYLDYDDAIFHTYDLSENIFIKKIFSNKIKYLMKESDGVICGNKYIEKYAHNSGAKNTLILPTVIDIDKYTNKPVNKIHSESFTIGWIGSPSTTKYLEIVREPLARLGQLMPVTLYLVGADNTKKITIDNVQIVSEPWSEDNEQKALKAFDIGIMPLNDDPWAKGKCAFKIIQYMGSFLPVVASSVGMNSEVVKNGNNGFLAVNSEDWFTAFYRLNSDEELRKVMGRNGRILVEENFTIQSRLSDFMKFVSNSEVTEVEPIMLELDQLPISVVIPIYNDKDSFENVFEAVCKQTIRPKQIVIIDSSDIDDIGINLHKYNDNIEIEYKKVERSFPGRARNLGAQIASEKYLAFLDSKTVPKSNWLSDSFAMLRDYDVVLGSVVYKGVDRFKKLMSVAIYGENSVESISGTLMLKSVFFKIGLFNEKARAGEDIDWRIRAKESEFNYYVPGKANTVYSEISSNLIFHIKRSFVYQMHGARLDIQHSTKVVFLSLFLILLASLVPIWNDIVGYDNNVFFVPHILKIFLLFLGLFVFFAFIYFKLFIINVRKRRSLKFLINFSLFIWISIVVYNWNEGVAHWDVDSPFFVPYLTKYYFLGLLSSSIIIRGIILPIKRGVHNNYLFPYRWASIGLIGLTLDFSKAPGYLLGSLVVIYIKVKSQFSGRKKE